MQQAERAEVGLGTGRKRVDVMVEAQVASSGTGESLAAVTHDARNMVAALGLYCDLLEQPGVLSAGFAHYGRELRQVATASRNLVEKMAGIDHPQTSSPANVWRTEGAAERWPVRLLGARSDGSEFKSPRAWVSNLAAELLATRNVLGALSGPWVAITMEVVRGARSVRITAEDLMRVLVNLVKNAGEAMPRGGRIQIGLRERVGQDGEWLVLTVEDSGPGIPDEMLDRIFKSGVSGHTREDVRPANHRGLGLSISRAIIETAGGRIHAENTITGGARIVIELPAEQ
jgi:signal transduction histidine kinase